MKTASHTGTLSDSSNECHYGEQDKSGEIGQNVQLASSLNISTPLLMYNLCLSVLVFSPRVNIKGRGVQQCFFSIKFNGERTP